MEHSQYQNLIGFRTVVDAERKSSNESFPHVAVDDRVEVGLFGDSVQNLLYGGNKLRPESL